ncbi:MAG TPA: hypothetical protein VH349_15760 [Ktedonobacterales bacterium]|jgi:hypothetical protein
MSICPRHVPATVEIVALVVALAVGVAALVEHAVSASDALITSRLQARTAPRRRIVAWLVLCNPAPPQYTAFSFQMG